MIETVEAPYVWKIRPLTAEEVVVHVNANWEVLAALIDTSPTYPLPDDQIRNCLFHMFVEYEEFARSIIASAEPPPEVLASVAPRVAAQVAIAILELTRDSMPHQFFSALVVVNLSDCSSILSGRRH